jgi:hypothetical protein
LEKDGSPTLFQVGKIGGKGGSRIHLSHLKIKVVEFPPYGKTGKGFFAQKFSIGFVILRSKELPFIKKNLF